MSEILLLLVLSIASCVFWKGAGKGMGDEGGNTSDGMVSADRPPSSKGMLRLKRQSWHSRGLNSPASRPALETGSYSSSSSSSYAAAADARSSYALSSVLDRARYAPAPVKRDIGFSSSLPPTLEFFFSLLHFNVARPPARRSFAHSLTHPPNRLWFASTGHQRETHQSYLYSSSFTTPKPSILLPQPAVLANLMPTPTPAKE